MVYSHAEIACIAKLAYGIHGFAHSYTLDVTANNVGKLTPTDTSTLKDEIAMVEN